MSFYSSPRIFPQSFVTDLRLLKINTDYNSINVYRNFSDNHTALKMKRATKWIEITDRSHRTKATSGLLSA